MGHYPKQTDQKMFQAQEPKTQPNRGVVPLDPESRGDLAPINAIRTNSLLSKLPVHTLSKKGPAEIRFTHRPNHRGQPDISWKVLPHDVLGAPRQLAYKLDTLFVNRKIEELGKPFPRIMPAGSLPDAARALGLHPDDTASIKHAMRQNSGAYIICKLPHPAREGDYLEGNGTRYNLAFRGQILPDGSIAETVYILWNEPFYTILNNSPQRPLDYDYLKLLAPAAQRFYELVSFQIFAALKHSHPEAKLRYSEYCQQAPQMCYHDRARAQKQMYKVHRPHIRSGYILKGRWGKTTDQQGRPDWFIHYTPGPKAFTEYQTFTGKAPKTRRPRAISPARTKPESRGVETTVKSLDPKRLLALTTRGVVKTEAVKFLSDAPADLLGHIDDSLEYFDSLPRDRMTNPGAFLAELVRKKISIAETFETTRQRQDRQAREEEQKRQQDQEARLRIQYRQDCEQQLEQYIATNPQEFREQVEAETARTLEALRPYQKMSADLKHRNAATSATGKVRSAMAERICPSFEDRKNGRVDFAEVSAKEASQPQRPEKTGSENPRNASPHLSEGESTRE